MKHSKIDYKNDIKVLGRVVSIATENKVAEAEQIFDTTFKYGDGPEGMNQYDINRLLKEAIINIQGDVTNLTEIQNKVAEIPVLKSDMNDLKSRVNTLEGKVSALENAIATLQSCCQDVQSRLTALENGNTPEPTPQPVRPTSISINGPSRVEKGDSATYTVTIIPSNADTDTSITWTKVSGVGQINSNGVYSSSETGSCTIKATTANEKSATKNIEVYEEETPTQPTSWVLNISPASVSADVDEEFTITATDGTTNGGMNNIMIPSVSNGLTLVSTQPNGTNPLSKKFTFKGTAAGTYTIAVVGMADDIEVTRKQVSVTISNGETPEEPVNYVMVAEPWDTQLQVGGESKTMLLYIAPERTFEPEYEGHWIYFIEATDPAGITDVRRGEANGRATITFEPASEANTPNGIIYNVYGIMGTNEEIVRKGVSNLDAWTGQDYLMVDLPKCSTTFLVFTSPAEEEPEPTKHNLIFYDTGLQPTEVDEHSGNNYTIVESEYLLNTWYPNNFEVGRVEFPAGNPTSDPTLDSLIAQINEDDVKAICLQHGIDRSKYELTWDQGGYHYNWPDNDVYIKAVWFGPYGDTRHVTFIYDPTTSNDTKIISVDGASKDDFTRENNGGYSNVFMYGNAYGLIKDTGFESDGTRTYNITIDNGYRITGIDPNYQYNTNTTPEENARLDRHISYTIAADGKSMSVTVNDVYEGNGVRTTLEDDCNGYLDIVILYEAA